MKTVLVTGGSGMIGNALQRILCDQQDSTEVWRFISSSDGDLTFEEDVYPLFENYRPNIVVHLAANVGGLFKNMHEPLRMMEDNLLMNTLVLKYARKYKVEKVISVLSTCIFPEGAEDPLCPSRLHNGPPHPSNEGYAYAKRMMEVQTRLLSTAPDGTGCVGICLIPTNLYGPNDHFEPRNAHVLPALIHKCALAMAEHTDFVVKGTGRPLRQFLYADDFATQILAAVRATSEELPSGSYICSPPASETITIQTLAETILEVFIEMEDTLPYIPRIQFDPQYADGQYKKITHPHPFMNTFPLTPLKEGLRSTIAWYKNGNHRIN